MREQELEDLVMCVKINDEAHLPYVVLCICHSCLLSLTNNIFPFFIIQLVHVKMVTPRGVIEKNCQVLQYLHKYKYKHAQHINVMN